MYPWSGVLKALREQGMHQELCIPLVATWYIEIPVCNMQVFFSGTIKNRTNKN